jgi:hypothetical protein
MADCGSAASCATDCDNQVKEVAKSMGGATKRFNKDKQSGARSEAGLAMKACLDDGSSLSDCKAKAKEAFLASGGTEEHFAGEQRRGAGDLAARGLKACMVESAGNKTFAAECISAACADHANSGGHQADCWFDRKQALLRWILQHCEMQDTGCTDAEAEAYAKDVLMASDLDWSASDWDNVWGNKDNMTTMSDTPHLDALFSMSKPGETSAQMKARLNGGMQPYCDAAKTALGANSATAVGTSDDSSDTAAHLACRLTFANAAASTTGETKLRKGDANTAVADVATRRLGATASARFLSTVSSSGQGSQVTVEENAESGTGGAGGGGATTEAAGTTKASSGEPRLGQASEATLAKTSSPVVLALLLVTCSYGI